MNNFVSINNLDKGIQAAIREPQDPPAQGPAVHPTRLAAAQNNQQANDIDTLPGNLLTYVDMKARPEIVIERVTTDQERMAGAITKISYPDLDQNPLPVREPITQVRLSQRFND